MTVKTATLSDVMERLEVLRRRKNKDNVYDEKVTAEEMLVKIDAAEEQKKKKVMDRREKRRRKKEREEEEKLDQDEEDEVTKQRRAMGLPVNFG